jgi:hypothetical protein
MKRKNEKVHSLGDRKGIVWIKWGEQCKSKRKRRERWI